MIRPVRRHSFSTLIAKALSMPAPEPVLGIDLGTTFSCVACAVDGGSVRLLPNQQGKRLMPSCIYVDGDSVLVGHEARQHARLHPTHAAQKIKRALGRREALF